MLLLQVLKESYAQLLSESSTLQQSSDVIAARLGQEGDALRATVEQLQRQVVEYEENKAQLEGNYKENDDIVRSQLTQVSYKSSLTPSALYYYCIIFTHYFIYCYTVVIVKAQSRIQQLISSLETNEGVIEEVKRLLESERQGHEVTRTQVSYTVSVWLYTYHYGIFFMWCFICRLKVCSRSSPMNRVRTRSVIVLLRCHRILWNEHVYGSVFVSIYEYIVVM